MIQSLCSVGKVSPDLLQCCNKVNRGLLPDSALTKQLMTKLFNQVGRKISAVRLAMLALLAAVLGSASAFAAAADPGTVTSSATTAYEAVTTLVVAMVIFWTIIAIVKRVRKGS